MIAFTFTITSAEPSDATSPPTVLLRGHKCLEFLTTIIVLKNPLPVGVPGGATTGTLPIDCTFATITASQSEFDELRDKAIRGTANQLRVEFRVGDDGILRTVTLIDTLTNARLRALLVEVEDINAKVGAGFTSVAQKLDRINETLIERLPAPQDSDSMSESLAAAEGNSSEGTHNNSGDDASSRLI